MINNNFDWTNTRDGVNVINNNFDWTNTRDGVIREKHSPLNLLRSKTGVCGFYSGVNLAYAVFTPQAKPHQNYSLHAKYAPQNFKMK